MTENLYLIIDSSNLEVEFPGFIILPLENYISESYAYVALKHVYIHHESDVRLLFQFDGKTQPIYVHCSLLNKDDNLVNGQKSDVLAIFYPEARSRRDFCGKPTNNSFKLMKPDTKIAMTLTNVDGTLVDKRSTFRVVYELEFSYF